MVCRAIEPVLVILIASWSNAAPLKLAQLDHTFWTTRDGTPLHIRDTQQHKDGTL
jgi:hypothetical protein